MTLFKNGAEGQTNGTAVTTGNSGASGDAFGVLSGTVTYDNAHAAHGSLGFKLSPASGSNASVVFGSGVSGLTGTSYSSRFYIYLTAFPPGSTEIWRSNAASASLLSRVSINASGQFVTAYNNGATTTLWTSVSTIPVNTWVRVETYTVLGSGGQFQAAFYNGDSTTAIDSGGGTGLTINAGPLQTVSFGKYGTDAHANAFWLDELAVNNSATGFMGPFTEQLATPVVTLGAATNPSTIGGTNGSQVVSWSAIPNAVAYDAYLAIGSSPTQGNFNLVASNVTSPYTFNGLGAGTYSYGIRAR